MPHSGGGGSTGGGFHSSSSGGSSHPSTRTSTRPFPGAICYVYYDSHHRARTLYTNSDPSKAKKNSIGTYVFLGLFALAPAVIIGIFGNHFPKKLDTNYQTSMVIEDSLNVCAQTEKDALNQTFHEFFTVTGICPSLVTVDDATWKAKHGNLEGYGISKYLSLFPTDERHFLITVASADASLSSASFEFTIGDETDNVLSKKTLRAIGEPFLASLEAKVDPAKGLNEALKSVLPTIMDYYFYVDPTLWVFVGIWEGLIGLAVAGTIINSIRNKNLKTAVKTDGKLSMKKCPHCGNEYYEGTISRCPKCQAFLDDSPRYAHYEDPDQ